MKALWPNFANAISLWEILVTIIPGQRQSHGPSEPGGKAAAAPERGFDIEGCSVGAVGEISIVLGWDGGEAVYAEEGRARQGEVTKEDFASGKHDGHKVDVELGRGGVPVRAVSLLAS